MVCPTFDWLWLKSDTRKFNTYNWTLHHPRVKSDSFKFLKKSYKGPSFKWAPFQNNSCIDKKVTIFSGIPDFWVQNENFLGVRSDLGNVNIGMHHLEKGFFADILSKLGSYKRGTLVPVISLLRVTLPTSILRYNCMVHIYFLYH